MGTINDRINLILSEFNLNKNSLSVKLGYANNTSTGKIINGIQKPGFDFLFRLLQTYHRINANWLITGEGEMFQSSVSHEEKIALFEKEIKYLKELVDTKNQLIDQLKIVNKRNYELLNQIEILSEILKDYQKDKEQLREQLRVNGTTNTDK